LFLFYIIFKLIFFSNFTLLYIFFLFIFDFYSFYC
jgi:hypothetical protein